MPLQNRVDPFGSIHAAPARGLFTGNRGVIHDPATKNLLSRRWTTKAWIICDLVHPKSARREPMGRNSPSGDVGWTELFFLDEVTALAAGHRPCFYCRREAANDFRRCFTIGNGLAAATAPEVDAVLHSQRIAASRPAPSLDDRTIRDLPDGAMIAFGSRIFAMRAGALLAWTFSGYAEPLAPTCRTLPADARLVTPPSTVAALRAGYAPVWHPGAYSR